MALSIYIKLPRYRTRLGYVRALGRRTLLAVVAVMFLGAAASATAAQTQQAESVNDQFTSLEKASGGRLGVYAINTETGTQLGYRADERFPLCSTFKVMASAAILARSAHTSGLLQRHVRYTQEDLVTYSPITEKHLDDGMTLAALCSAALQYSDNTAGNMLIKQLGGTGQVTEFARSIGDKQFRLDRYETELNTAFPGDLRDTTTPRAMATSLRALTLGDALPPAQREQLVVWLKGNTTGDKRIRAGVPGDWQVADKTGSGDYGTSNDIAVLWPPKQKPIVLAIYYTGDSPDSEWRNDVLASAAQIVLEGFGYSTSPE